MKSIILEPVKCTKNIEDVSPLSVNVYIEYIHHENHHLYNKDDKNRFAKESEEKSFNLKCEFKEIPYLLKAIEEVNLSIINYEDKSYTLPSIDDKSRVSASFVIDNKLKRFLIPVIKEKGRKVGFAHLYVKKLNFINENSEIFEAKWNEK